MDNYKSMFESRISPGAVEKLPETKAPGKPETNTISSWSFDMEGRAKKSKIKHEETRCVIPHQTSTPKPS